MRNERTDVPTLIRNGQVLTRRAAIDMTLRTLTAVHTYALGSNKNKIAETGRRAGHNQNWIR